MALSRKGKILLLLAIPLLVIAGSVITLKLIFTPARLKAMVIAKAEETTGRTVSIGDVSLVFWPRIGVKIDTLSVSNRRGEGFSATPFLAMDALRLDAGFLPLLKGEIEITSLTIVRPRLLLEVNAANVANYASPAETGSGGAGGTPAAASGTFLISGLRIIDGTLEFVNRRENSAIRARGFAWTTTIEGTSGRVLFAGKASVDSLSYGPVNAPLIAGLRMTLDHKVAYDGAADVLSIPTGDLTVQAMRLVLGGTITDLRKDPGLHLTVAADSLEIPDLLSLIPKEYAKNTEGVRGGGKAALRISITGTLTDSTSADVTGSIRAVGATLQYPGLPRPITDVNLAATFARTTVQQEFRVEKFSAALGENVLTAEMTAVNFADPSVSFAAAGTLDLGTIGQYYPLEKGTTLEGTIDGSVRVAGKVSAPATAKASGTISLRKVTVAAAAAKNPVRNLQGTIAFTNTSIGSERLSMTVGRSDLVTGFRLANYLSLVFGDRGAPRPVATMTLRSDRLFTDDIMGGEASVPPGSAAPRPAGTPAARAARLPLPGIDMDVNVEIGTLTTEKFVFSNVRGAVRISDGVITLNNLTLGAFGGTVASRGSLNYRNPDKPAFDLGLEMNGVDAGPMLSRFTSFGARLTGKMTMSTAVKGSLNDTLGLVPGSLDGTGNVAVRDGALRGFKVNQALASTLRLPDLDTVRFHDWTNAFTIKEGRIVIKDLKINAFNADYVVNGSQGLDGTLDYALTLLLPETASSRIAIAGFAGEAVKLFKEPGGRLKLDFLVGGSTDDPKVRLNTEPARLRAEELAKQKLNEEGKKLQDQLKQKAGDALKNLFKKKP